MNPVGNDPTTVSYDYQNGSGFDSFMSRSLGEVVWQTSLNSFYNTLAQYPVGQSPNQAINYDAAQIAGSQAGTTVMGSSGTGSGGGIAMDATNGAISLNNGSLSINNTSNGNSINASAGQISYNGNNGSTAVQEGILSDGTRGMEVFNANNTLVAQFGQLNNNQGTGMAILNPQGNIIALFGELSDGNPGIQFNGSSNNKLFQLEGSTWKWFDNNGLNMMQVGELPDGSYGWAVATPGHQVSEAYS